MHAAALKTPHASLARTTYQRKRAFVQASCNLERT